MPSVNRHLPHVLVLPEDRANNDIANGFQEHECVSYEKMRILGSAGGWRHVYGLLVSDYQADMRKYANQFMILLLDFDGQTDRLSEVRREVPEDLRDRVFIIGSRTNPESLKSHLDCSYEEIGRRLAEDCRLNSTITWGSALLSNNLDELARLNMAVRPFLIKP